MVFDPFYYLLVDLFCADHAVIFARLEAEAWEIAFSDRGVPLFLDFELLLDGVVHD